VRFFAIAFGLKRGAAVSVIVIRVLSINNAGIQLRRVEFAVTYQCNSRCRHCYTLEKRNRFKGHLNPETGPAIVKELAAKYPLDSVMTFGGEPMLYPDITADIHRQAKDCGIPSRELITNGFWARDETRIAEIAGILAAAGVNEVVFSVDVFHQEHIPVEKVKQSITACSNAGMENLILNPCWVMGENYSNPFNIQTRAVLDSFHGFDVEISEGNIIEPLGLAATHLREYLPERHRIPRGRCMDVPYTDSLDAISGICIEPDGMVAVCNDLYIGNSSDENIIEIIKKYNPYSVPELRAILEGGVEGLVEFARSQGVDPEESGYYSICDCCIDIRRKLGEMGSRSYRSRL